MKEKEKDKEKEGEKDEDIPDLVISDEKDN